MLNNLRDDAHATAVDKGWWETVPPFYQIINLCHSELSEALEAYRSDEPDFYINSAQLSAKGAKPTGVSVELADCIIRILDYCGYAEIDIEAKARKARPPKVHDDLMLLLCDCHNLLSEADMTYMGPAHGHPEARFLGACIRLILDWCHDNDADIYAAIRDKMEYNKRRPYRHGGKRA